MPPERPILRLERSPVERVADALTLAGLAVMLTALVATFVWVDGPVPTHMNAAGEPDAWGSSKGGLLILAMLGGGIPAVLTGLRGAPHTFNYPSGVTPENAPRMYRLGRELLAIMGASVAWTFAEILVSFALVSARIVSSAPWGLPFSLAITFVPLAVYIVKMRRAA
ncbi:MAG: hypothetical protein ACK4YP_01325 [Myxococcota bacterium]